MAVRHAVCAADGTLTVYRGLSINLPWTYKNEDGTGFDLTGKTIVFKLRIDDTVHTYTDTPNTYGSVVTITDAVNGEFTVLVAKEETALFDTTTNGVWWLELHTGGVAELLYKDTAIVQDI